MGFFDRIFGRKPAPEIKLPPNEPTGQYRAAPCEEITVHDVQHSHRAFLAEIFGTDGEEAASDPGQRTYMVPNAFDCFRKFARMRQVEDDKVFPSYDFQVYESDVRRFCIVTVGRGTFHVSVDPF